VVSTEVCDFNVGAVLKDGSREYALQGWVTMVSKTANKNDAAARPDQAIRRRQAEICRRGPAPAAITPQPAHLGKPDKTRSGDEDKRKYVGEASRKRP
jgi:hypothetical protein